MRSVKGAECVPAEGLTHSPVDRDGLDSHSVVPVFSWKRLPTKVAAKVEPGENDKLAIRLDESASSGLSEFRADSQFSLVRRTLAQQIRAVLPSNKSLTERSAGGATCAPRNAILVQGSDWRA